MLLEFLQKILEKKLIFALVKLKLCIMFRSFIFLLVSLLLVSCETSSHREMDWKDQNLHGKVKKLIVTLYRISNSDFIKREDGTPFMIQERLTVNIFNNKGFLMEETDSIYNKPKVRFIYNYLNYIDFFLKSIIIFVKYFLIIILVRCYYYKQQQKIRFIE